MVPSNVAHYLGRGNQNMNGVGLQELSAITLVTKRASARIPKLTADRGLIAPTKK